MPSLHHFSRWRRKCRHCDYTNNYRGDRFCGRCEQDLDAAFEPYPAGDEAADLDNLQAMARRKGVEPMLNAW